MQDKRAENREKLQHLLRNLFQFDHSDLDFGIYRIMNQKRDEVERFIEEDLLDIVESALARFQEADREKLEATLAEKRVQLGPALDESGAVREQFRDMPIAGEYEDLRRQLQQMGVAEETEARVFNDLSRFFSRYYDQGDFLTERRYSSRGAKYCVPYNGEEVMLHWANRDQYYVKTSELFTDYRFTVGDYTVSFRMEQAEVPQDNVKGDKRYFVLQTEQSPAYDDQAQALTIPFAYRPLTEEEEAHYLDIYNAQQSKSNQRKTLDRSVLCVALETEILNTLDDADLKAALAAVPDSKEASALGRHLNRYTARHTMDYFVHKDLGGFLRRELDVFLKTEVMDLGDVVSDESAEVAQHALTRMRVERDIGLQIIDFLAQIEDFQKRLFEKRKFVVQTDYCVTLDRVPSELYQEILENDAQLEEWRRLYSIDDWDNDLFWQGEFDRAFLEHHPHLMTDTAFFDPDFKGRLLGSFEDLDESVDGLLIHGENFQALNLLMAKYREQIQHIYLDPPYNTRGHSEILYKNNYKDSSWLALMRDRLALGRPFMQDSAVVTIAIDDYEMPHLCELADDVFGQHERSMIVVNHHPQGSGGANVSRTHEYALFMTPEGEDLLKGKRIEDHIEHRPFMRSGTAENNYRYGRPNSFYAVLVDPETLEVKGVEEPPPASAEDYPTGSTDEGLLRIYPIGGDGSERVWRRSYESAREEVARGSIVCRESHTLYLLVEHEGRRAPLYSNWTAKRYNAGTYGTNLIADLFGDAQVFSYPKSLFTVRDSIEAVTHDSPRAIILDYFAGSGTTAHAVMDLNREEDSDREYIIVEMGEYFDTVLKPRILKVAFSSNWKDGVPQDRDGMSHMVKYHRIESYEDALNNIRVQRAEGGQLELLREFDDYMLHYMLDFETRDSPTLLVQEAFEKPFEYTLKIQQGHESPEDTAVDLVETFHYLIGMHVRQLERHEHQGRTYVVSRGEAHTEHGIEKVATVWRDTEGLDREEEARWVDEEILTEPLDRVYVNGPSFINKAEPLEITFRNRLEGGADGAY